MKELGLSKKKVTTQRKNSVCKSLLQKGRALAVFLLDTTRSNGEQLRFEWFL